MQKSHFFATAPIFLTHNLLNYFALGELDAGGYYLEIKGNDLIISRKNYRPVRNLPSILRAFTCMSAIMTL